MKNQKASALENLPIKLEFFASLMLQVIMPSPVA
jgi:hypothetical protein